MLGGGERKHAMSILDLFSKRQNRLQGEISDVYEYERLPETLRVQIVHIWNDALGNQEQYHDRYDRYGTRVAYQMVVKALCREYGVFKLVDTYGDRDYMQELVNFFLHEQNVERAIAAEIRSQLDPRGRIEHTRERRRRVHDRDPTAFLDSEFLGERGSRVAGQRVPLLDDDAGRRASAYSSEPTPK